MVDQSRQISGMTFAEEVEERVRREKIGLSITTSHTGELFTSQVEVRTWFYSTFREHLLWSGGESNGENVYHTWLPRTKDQAMLLKLRYGGQ